MTALPRPASELAALVAAETRFDAALAAARAQANAIVAAARRDAEAATASLDAEIARERERIAIAVNTATDAELAAIARDARAQVERFEAVCGEAAAEIARSLADVVVAEAVS